MGLHIHILKDLFHTFLSTAQKSNQKSQFCLLAAYLRGQLLLEDVLEGDGIGSKLADTLAQLLDGHLVLVEVESEEGLVVDVGLLLEVQGRGAGSVQLLGDGLVGVEELLKKVGLKKRVMLVIREL